MATGFESYTASRKRPSASHILWLIGLAALSGSGWLLTEAYPSEMTFPFAGCLHFAVIGLVGAVAGGWKGRTRKRIGAIALTGLGIFALPGIIARLTAGTISESASVAVFCSVPLMVVLASAWFGEASQRRSMMPGLVGLFGALLVFSVELPDTPRRVAGLAAVILCAALVAAMGVWMFQLMQGVEVAAAVTVVGISGAVLLGAYGISVGWPTMTVHAVGVEAIRCLILDFPVVWLTVWLMRELPPARLAARFLIAPMITLLEGYAIVRGPVALRSGVAIVLMAAGAGMLLWKEEPAEEPGLRLR